MRWFIQAKRIVIFKILIYSSFFHNFTLTSKPAYVPDAKCRLDRETSTECTWYLFRRGFVLHSDYWLFYLPTTYLAAVSNTFPHWFGLIFANLDSTRHMKKQWLRNIYLTTWKNRASTRGCGGNARTHVSKFRFTLEEKPVVKIYLEISFPFSGRIPASFMML